MLFNFGLLYPLDTRGHFGLFHKETVHYNSALIWIWNTVRCVLWTASSLYEHTARGRRVLLIILLKLTFVGEWNILNTRSTTCKNSRITGKGYTTKPNVPVCVCVCVCVCVSTASDWRHSSVVIVPPSPSQPEGRSVCCYGNSRPGQHQWYRSE